MSPAAPDSPRASSSSFTFRLFEILFLLSLAVFPAFLGSVRLWSFCFGAVLLCGGFGLHWFSRLGRHGRVLRTELDPWIGIYAAAFLVSLAFSKVPYLSWIECFKLAVVLCAFWATRYLCRERAQIYRLSESFVFLGGILSAAGLLQFVGGLPNDWWARPYFLSSTYVNHNHFAGILVLVLPMSFGLVLAERGRSKKVLFIFLTVLMGIAFVFTLSRGAFVALLAAMGWMIVMLKQRGMISRSILPFAVLIVLVVGAVVIFGTAPLEERLENTLAIRQEEDMSLKLRLLTWQGTIPMIKHFFWFGSGPGTFGHLFLPFRPSGFSMRSVYTHNDFLQLWAECGVFAFAAACGLFFVFFAKGLRLLRVDDSRLRIGVGSGILAGTLGMLVHALIDFNFHIPANWLLSAVAAGLLFSMGEDHFYHSRPVSLSLKTAISALVALSLVFAVYLGTADYRLWEAEGFYREGEKGMALEAAERSATMNPNDPEPWYFKGFIRLTKDPAAAVRDFEEAIRRNPYEPVYELGKARARAESLASASPSELAALFQRAVDKDPKNPLIAFTAARAMLAQDKEHSRILRDAAERLLVRAVKLDPAFAEKAYQVLWSHERNISKLREFHEKAPEGLEGLVVFMERRDLWRYHRIYHLRSLRIDPDKDRQLALNGPWNEHKAQSLTLGDFSHIGKEPPNVDDFFFVNGELIKKLNIDNPLELLMLRAYGNPSKAVYPTLYVKLDGKIVDEYYVDSKSPKNFYTVLRTTPGPHLLTLQYVNDLSVPGPGGREEDRNVWVERVTLAEPA